MRSIYVTLCLLCSLFTCSWASDQISRDVPAGFVSGVQAPEDLFQLPGTNWVAVSSMQSPDGKPGHLDVIDALAPNRRAPIYPARETGIHADAHRFPACTPPDPRQFFPHGINSVRLSKGKFELYAINHGGRESLEIFSLTVSATSVHADWIGCVQLPRGSYGNGVAPLPGGGFVVTKMYDPTDASFLAKFDAGAFTGTVLAWKPALGWFNAVPQELSGANGVEVSHDGRWLYVSEWSAKRLWKISLDGTEKPKQVSFSFLPDNLRWTPQGTLLLAGQNAKPSQVFGCEARHVACPEKFTVAEINPTDLQVRILIRGGDGSFGGATGAALVNGKIWVGSFRGTRIAQYRLMGK